MKAEGEKISVEAGKKSQKEEAFRVGKKAIKAVLMQLLAELVKEIIAKLVKWFKSTGKKIETLLSSLKEAIVSFVGKLKTHLLNATDTLVSTIATAIFGPVIGTIKKVWTMLKQGWRSLKEAIAYIKNPENKGKPVGILILEVGKIVMAGLSAVGAIVLGEIIEKGLIAIPGIGTALAFEIPLLGSIANILGIFLGAVVAGIIGAIAINLLDKVIEKQKKTDIISQKIDKGNEVLNLQHKVKIVNEAKLEKNKADATAITSEQSEEATISLLRKLSVITDSENYSSEIKKLAAVVKDSLVKYYGYIKVSEICNKDKSENDTRTLSELLNELNELVGLKSVKERSV